MDPRRRAGARRLTHAREAGAHLGHPLIFRALLTAVVLLPMDGAPRRLKVVSMLNPMTYVVDATRALFAGTYPADVVAQGVAGAAVVTALGLVVGVRAMRSSS